MKIRIISHSLGPNIRAPVAAIRARLEPAIPLTWRSDRTVVAFLEPLDSLLPDLRTRIEAGLPPHGLDSMVSVRGDADIPVAVIVAHLAAALMRRAGYKSDFAKARSTDRSDIFHIVCECHDISVGRLAMRPAIALFLSLLRPDELSAAGVAEDEINPAHTVRQFLNRAERDGVGSNAAAILRAADARAIPWFRLEAGQRVIQLGQGIHQRRLSGGMPDQAPMTAIEISSNKTLQGNVLASLGLPVSEFMYAPTADKAVSVAESLGYPVVLKPNQRKADGRMFTALTDARGVRTAFNRTVGKGEQALVQKFMDGNSHRLLAVGGRLVAAMRCDSRIVTEAGRSRATLTMVDVTDDIHPDNRAMALETAMAIGLDVAEINFVTSDIGKPYLDVGGTICTVSESPDLRLYGAAQGQKRDVVTPILDYLFPPDADVRVPVAAITGTNGKTTTSHMLAQIHESAGKCVGLCSTFGVSIGGRLLKKLDLAGWAGVGAVLANRKTEIAVLESAHGGLHDRGFGVDYCDVGAVLNVTMDHLGETGIKTIENMARIKSLVVTSARDTAVLNADDPLCLAMVDQVTAKHVCLVTLEPDNDRVADHIKAGGRAGRLEDTDSGPVLALYDNGDRSPIMAVDDISATFGGAARHNIQNALFAAAMAHAMGCTLDQIRSGLAAFDAIPGRTNLYENLPFKVLVDFAHNPSAFDSIGCMVGALAEGGRRICVFTSPKDRNDAHLAEVARVVAGHFDYFICRESAVARGGDSIVADKLRDALTGLGIADDHIAVIPNEDDAIMAGLTMARPGDVLFVMFSPSPDTKVWDLIKSFAPS